MKSLFQLQTLGMCSSNPNDTASFSLDKSWYDEKLCTVWRIYFTYSPNVNLLSFRSLTNFFSWGLVTGMDFCLIDLSRLYITPLNRTSPTWAFSFIDNCIISSLSLRFLWYFCCNSVFIIILAILLLILLLQILVEDLLFLHVLIKLISLLILNHLRLAFSNDLTFSNTKRPCFFSIYLKILIRTNSLIANNNIISVLYLFTIYWIRGFLLQCRLFYLDFYFQQFLY